MEPTTYKIEITGTVQGVGFRPFIYKLAQTYALEGSVSNDGSGVEIELCTTHAVLELFIEDIKTKAPPLSEIREICFSKIAPKIFRGFSIIQSDESGLKTTLIPPDISICSACEAELFDPHNRRYLYPFITCTNCGVRYSIIKTLPYDRQHTSMAKFRMCKACEKEYKDPMDRRYHAQPIGCYACGPTLSMDLEKVALLIKEGAIVAIKGVGGYHLVCDATNDSAVLKLRTRKKRPTKPYAVMVRDIDEASKLAHINAQEQKLLNSKERPIVLLKTKENDLLSKHVAPHITKIGLFLPYTPIHLLLLERLQRPMVATSANITDEPICTDIESLEKLEGIYDYVVDHDREIINGCDDSVLTVVAGQTLMLRRARGFAPASVKLPFSLQKNVLALGANQKSTIAIGFDKEVILSPHIGDLDTLGSVRYFAQNIETLQRVYDFTPEVVVHDKHPDYESTKYAKMHYQKSYAVQHHYAHILGVMAEKQITEKVLGVAFDGTGYGDDGTLWGGEFLVCDYLGYERVFHLKPFKLLGGAKAIKEPKRVALSLLFDLYGKEALTLKNPTTNAFSQVERKVHFVAWQKGLNTPLSSSMGRLFDAVASLTGVCQTMSFEGESGMLLEELYDPEITQRYSLHYQEGEIDFLEMIEALLAEKELHVGVSKFFNTIVEMIVHVASVYDLPLVVSGGVFQNSVLMGLVMQRVPQVIFSTTIPPNDGGIALGQVVFAQSVKR
ncbi:MAG: carbamoyltransferase HypF [Epsilonproteobacteria bacterium]|nr:carbamoyltransferase HypF [Campylobacterota bacterium]